jgi:ankyrin repeat protein
MSHPLPGRLDIERLRRQAKELRDAAGTGAAAALNRFAAHGFPQPGHVTLSAAQLVIAREHGFVSWARLKIAVDASAAPDLAALVDQFLTASVSDKPRLAARLLRANPAIASHDISTCAVLGDLTGVQEHLEADPAAAVRPDARRGWAPLLYACHSAWHAVDQVRAEGIQQVVWLLLDTGASANTTTGRRTALFGAAHFANNPAVASQLLRYGADPNACEVLYHAALHPDAACLRLLLGHGARTVGTDAFSAAISSGEDIGVRLLLDAGADPGRPGSAGAEAGHLADGSLAPLPLAVADSGADAVEWLLTAGADPNGLGTDHRSCLRRAVRKGSADVVRLLKRHGARDDSTEMDNFLGACRRADRNGAHHLLGGSPGLVRRLTDEDLGALADAAEHAPLAAVRLMLDLGFPVGAPRSADGATALHAAAYAGRAAVVALLLERGAQVNAADRQWGATALAWATIGSGERPRTARDADWPGTVRTLLAAGSNVDDAWIDGKPPSEDIAAVLVDLGIDEPDRADD